MNNAQQIIFPKTIFEKLKEAFEQLATYMCNLAESIIDYLIEWSEELFPNINFWVYMQNTYPHKRVKHLALYSKSARTRKKNLRRIIKSYQNQLKKEGIR